VIDFRAETSLAGGVGTVRLEGELDLTSAAEAEASIRQLEEEGGATTLIIDLRGVRFLDSTGLRVILAADSRARREGWRLQIVPGPEPVHRVFRIALLDRRLEFVGPDGDDA
jgi:anti-sigma B factor antagonist